MRPNIVFGDQVAGNPTAEVEVRAAPDGTIVGRRLVKSSGIPEHLKAELLMFAGIEQVALFTRDECHVSKHIGFGPSI